MKKEVKEPIKVKWIWPVIAIISLLTIPWLFPQGSYYPIIAGFPLWMVVSILATIALAIFLNFVVDKFWDMEQLVEEDSEKIN
ncbi:MAG: hypothetical protein SCJ93_06115 [Bacillota bacterium]|nr:hypothetical protein [Bacillota bacterium]